MLARRHRRLIALRGTPAETAARAGALLASSAPDAVLWVGADAPAPFTSVAPAHTRRLLGRSFDAVVLDAHGGVDADLLGRVHGLVWGGGALILRRPPVGTLPERARAGLVVAPFAEDAVGLRFERRFEAALARAPQADAVGQAVHALHGTAEQHAVVARLVRAFGDPAPSTVALLADRGRGKSSALGLAIRAAREAGPLRVVVTADSPGAAAEVFRFATGAPAPPTVDDVRFVPPTALARAEVEADVIVVDEAAQLPVALLQRIAAAHPAARLAFATTAHGYEGTGRGFVLRFLEWARAQPRPFELLTLRDPIRWDAGDPLERFVFDALLLDAEPAPPPAVPSPDAVRHVAYDRDALAADEDALRQVFGLLVHAHYRTTPGDLHRLLDAPNLRVHALTAAGRVVAASLVALEGGLDAATGAAVARGDARLRGHALVEMLAGHAGHVEAAGLRIVRSVRIAAHPDLRRLGLASRLVDAVHATYAPDLFGTLFGATPALLRFRRALGYALARVGVSAGSHSGEPGVVMLRPVSPAARDLLTALRADLARDLPLQLELMQAGDEVVLEPALVAALTADLPAATPRSPTARDALVHAYAFGPRPFEAVASAVVDFVLAHADRLAALSPAERAVVEARALQRRGWVAATAAAGLDSPRAAMRALRRAVRALWTLASAPPT
ncbi:MAG: tRNA(Met) cytidine acetyltransferase [Myxococcales bacterium]|nr:tRNA(Met) cytidine acetyltransferase [Myxococcales bacterium]